MQSAAESRGLKILTITDPNDGQANLSGNTGIRNPDIDDKGSHDSIKN